VHSTPLRWSSTGLTLAESVVLAICWISMTLKHRSDVRARACIKDVKSWPATGQRNWSERSRTLSVLLILPPMMTASSHIALDYVAYDGKSVHIRFQFTETGKIAASACRRSRKVA
jgi:hypothetical protein